MKIIRYIILSILIIAFAGVVFVLSMKQQTSDEKWRSDFAKDQIEILRSDGIRMIKRPSSEEVNQSVIFIHGAPGEGSQFLPYLSDSTLSSQADLYVLDRPGYGYSDYGKAIPQISVQARKIQNAINEQVDTTKEIILVSHSFGGPIGALLGILQPSLYKGHLMLCPVIDPVSEPMFWYSGLPLWWPFSLFSSGAMKTSAYEKKSHPDELKNLMNLWSKSEVKTKMIQGAEDWLAPIENAAFVREYFSKRYTEVEIMPDDSHFIPFNKADFVIEQILLLGSGSEIAD